MASEVEICSMAFVLLGTDPIEAFGNDNDREVIATQFYATTRDATLRAHPWGFAKERVDLALDSESPTWGSIDAGWDYQFVLPTDPWCLRVLRVKEAYPGQIPYAIEGRRLLTNESAIAILYIARIEDSGLFDALFTDALVAKLAMTFAISLSKQKTLLELAANLYKLKIDEAKTVDGL